MPTSSRGPAPRRARLRSRAAEAFAPAAITNFFAIENDSAGRPVGATGGGFILSRGVTTRASVTPGSESRIAISVNGDSNYDARTTRRAVALLLGGHHRDFGELHLGQSVDVPIGSGFGASGASATSAVLATAGAVGMNEPKEEIALSAHRAEIIEQTGLGTVSVVFGAVGAGAITKPGEPGRAKFVNVEVPRGVRLVTACLAPFDKKNALSSRALSSKINRLGGRALGAFLSDPTFDTLIREGERFSAEMGLESPEVRKLLRRAKSAGAISASQNMIGYSIHCVVDKESCAKVARALVGVYPGVRVDTFDVGARRAGLLRANRRSRGPG